MRYSTLKYMFLVMMTAMASIDVCAADSPRPQNRTQIREIRKGQSYSQSHSPSFFNKVKQFGTELCYNFYDKEDTTALIQKGLAIGNKLTHAIYSASDSSGIVMDVKRFGDRMVDAIYEPESTADTTFFNPEGAEGLDPWAQDVYADADSYPAISDTVTMPSSTKKGPKGKLLNKIIYYFKESNKTKPNKEFDFSFIGGPHYSSETSLAVAFLCAGQYKTDRNDSLLKMSNVAAKIDLSVVGFYEFGVNGNHINPGDRSRWNYDAVFDYMKTYFWGIGYDMDVNNSNKSSFKKIIFDFNTDFSWRIGSHLFAGPQLEFNYVHRFGVKDKDRYLWEGLPRTTFNWAPGFTIYLDSRDNMTNATRGVYLKYDQRFYAKMFGNKHAFTLSAINFSVYHRLWKSGVLAANIHGRFTYGDVPWTLMSTFGGTSTMRGYYQGRYLDKDMVEATVELRQHLYKRSGVAIWAGAGSVFPSFDKFSWRKILPSFGLGYRWEFKKNTNIRADFGIGKRSTAFILSIDEAF